MLRCFQNFLLLGCHIKSIAWWKRFWEYCSNWICDHLLIQFFAFRQRADLRLSIFTVGWDEANSAYWSLVLCKRKSWVWERTFIFIRFPGHNSILVWVLKHRGHVVQWEEWEGVGKGTCDITVRYKSSTWLRRDHCSRKHEVQSTLVFK